MAKATADDLKFQELATGNVVPIVYQDGGMNPKFRTLLKNNGAVRLAEKVSQIAYPVSRPEAALADPFNGNE